MNAVAALIKEYFTYYFNQYLILTKKMPVCCLLFFMPVMNTGSVAISWDANQESDLSGYKIYYGKASGNYNQTVNVGKVTSFQISGLDVGTRYFFAVTAIDYFDNESDYSEEVSADIPIPVDEEPQNKTQTLGTLVYNFPNPFKIPEENTYIRYDLANAVEITIEIFDLNSKLIKTLVKNELKGDGEHTEDVWDGTNSNGQFVANGVYVCRIQSTGVQWFIKIAVIR